MLVQATRPARSFISLIALALLLGQGAESQPRQPRGEGSGPFYFVEAVNLPSSDPGQSRIDILYRVDREFFIAVRNTDTTLPYGFIRKGDFSVELVDSLGNSKARDNERIFIGETTAQRDPAHRAWHQGVFSLSVPPGRYSLVVEITDRESRRDVVDRSRKVWAAPFGTKPLEISTPVFLFGAPPSATPDTVLAENYGSDYLWSSQGYLFFALGGTALTDSPVALHATISLVTRSAESPSVIARETLRVVPLRAMDVLPVQAGDDVGYCFKKNNSGGMACVFLPFPGDTLRLRDFRLEIEASQGTAKERVEKHFRTVWPDMPISLRNVDYALEALRYIVSEGQLDSLKTGDYEDRRANLEAFWDALGRRSGDARYTPMIQYYERVDYATRHFGTLKQPDGSKSDRGKVFILYGPATKTDRSLDPATGFTEVWTYERLKRTFTFRDQSKTGDYSLIATSAP